MKTRFLKRPDTNGTGQSCAVLRTSDSGRAGVDSGVPVLFRYAPRGGREVKDWQDPQMKALAGWTISPSGRVSPDTSVAGYAARHVEVAGRCYQRDCRRTCSIDTKDLVSRGLGRLAVSDLRRTLLCGRLGGCGMDFSETERFPLRLQSVGREGFALEIRCRTCRKSHVSGVAAIAAKLAKEGAGGGDTPLAQVSAAIKGPCGCGAKSWEVELLFCDPASAKKPLWRQELERRRAARAFDRDGPLAPSG